MTEESKNNAPESKPPSETLTEPSPPQPSAEQSNQLFIPKLDIRELQATWEMLVAFKQAIHQNDHWSGKDTQAVAMGLQMIMTMESHYRGQLEMAKERDKQNAKAIKDQIAKGGGVINAKAQTVH